MQETISIIGAGIGGLTTALSLQQKGFSVDIYEGAPEIKPVGAGIIIANNAMQVFQKLGLRGKITKAGNRISRIRMMDAELKNISSIDLTRFEQKYGVHNIAIHRADLQQILADEIGSRCIHLSKRLVSIAPGSPSRLTFDDGTTLLCNIVIGADGIKSVVRKSLFNGGNIRDAGQRCWRGLCTLELPEKYQHETTEAWGKGKRFGFVQLNERQVYWYAVVNTAMIPAGEFNLAAGFREFHPDIQGLIAATPAGQIMESGLSDLRPMHTWHSGNVCLIGDAAHATTPNLGQGACQAVEDAYTVGQLLGNGMPAEESFRQYEKLRMKKAYGIVSTSRQMGKLSQLENPVAIWLRNTVMRCLPGSANAKQLDRIFDVSYIQ